jgi:type II secretory pathway component PulF
LHITHRTAKPPVPTASPEITLTAPAAEAVLEQAAHAAATGMPLPAGLRMAARESDSRAVRRALTAVAEQLESGRTLEECLATSRRLPREFRGAIAAAEHSGAFSPLLVQWLEDRRAARERWRGILAAFSYPAIAVILALGVFLLFAVFVVPVFGRMYEDIGLQLPGITRMTIWAAEAGSRILLAVLGVGIVSILILRMVAGSAGWSLLIGSLPLIGLPWHWTSSAEMLRLISLLVEHRMDLPAALRLAAESTPDAYLSQQCRTLANRVEEGSSLTMALVHLRKLPLSVVPLIRWGERNGTLPEALRSAAEMIEGRLNLSIDVVVQILPPILLIFVGAMTVSMVLGIFLPLISFIQGLI